MAFVRKQGQAIQTPGYTTGTGMLGSGGVTGPAQPATMAGTPGGWTNIQDYLGANQGSTTNIDTAKQQTAQKIQKGAKSIQQQQENATPLAAPTAYSAEATNQALKDDDYGVFGQGLSQQAAQDQMSLLPSVEEQITGNAPLEKRINEITQLDPTNFDQTMQFVGDLGQGAPNYSQGAKAFDSMLLRGSPEFRQDFVPNVQQQYQEQYQQPLQQARETRTADIAGAQDAITAAQGGWQTGIGDWLTGQEGGIGTAAAAQQSHYQGMVNDANVDIDAQIQAYQQATGMAVPAGLVETWRRNKDTAQQFIGSQGAPTSGMAVNEYMGGQEDATRMQDMLALYELMEQTPTYTQPQADETYNYVTFI